MLHLAEVRKKASGYAASGSLIISNENVDERMGQNIFGLYLAVWLRAAHVKVRRTGDFREGFNSTKYKTRAQEEGAQTQVGGHSCQH